MPTFSLFDGDADFTIFERRLPHWSQSHALAFITWRTLDSLPAKVLSEWLAERAGWLRRQGIDADSAEWKAQVAELASKRQAEFWDLCGRRWHGLLDECHGACPFRDLKAAEIVAKSLLHFDGDRYDLTDFVIMPNHVHFLASFPSEDGMLTQVESWKHYMAFHLNKLLGGKGRFWQQDGFDHLVRSWKQFEYLRKYIAENPQKAGLPIGSCLHYSAAIKEC